MASPTQWTWVWASSRIGEWQGSLACCSPWSHKYLDMTESLNKVYQFLILVMHAKSWLIGKDPDAGRDWGKEEKGTTEDEMAGWHHWLGHEFEWTPGVGDGQGGLACCDSWGCKESDMTEWLNWTDWTDACCILRNSCPPHDVLCFLLYSNLMYYNFAKFIY